MDAPRTAHRSKFLAALLAFVLGGFGAHRLYLRSKFWWVYPVWLLAGIALFAAVATKSTTWIVVLALLPVWTGFAESLGFAVMPDARWDARFNAASTASSRNGWNCVLLAIVTLIIGTTICMTAIVISAQYYFEAASESAG